MNDINKRVEKLVEATKGTPIPIGWQFWGVGHQTECEGDIDDFWGIPMCKDGGITSSHWCEGGCEKFIGRWLSCACIKVWCRECWGKKERDGSTTE